MHVVHGQPPSRLPCSPNRTQHIITSTLDDEPPRVLSRGRIGSCALSDSGHLQRPVVVAILLLLLMMAAVSDPELVSVG